MAITHSVLPSNALRGWRVGVSVSESRDLNRLGLTEGHFRLALGEIARSVLVLGGKLAYGGHLRPNGYTLFLASELRRYARRDRPLLVCLPWSMHRQMELAELRAASEDLGLYGRIVCLDVNGKEINPDEGRREPATPELDPARVIQGLTGLRQYMTRQTQGRVLIGGNRETFQGEMPGLVEEALFAIAEKQPLFLAGGFGGITMDMVEVVEPSFARWLPAFTPARTRDPRATKSLEAFGMVTGGLGWRCFNNGLTADECQLLASTHRPSEIATLVCLGLGRLAGAKPVA